MDEQNRVLRTQLLLRLSGLEVCDFLRIFIFDFKFLTDIDLNF